MPTIPNIDATTQTKVSQDDEINYRKLVAEATAIENINKEADQRYSLRGWSVVVVSIMLILLFFLINTIVRKLLFIENWAEIPTIVVAIYAIPILSATVLAVSLLVASFRGYKDDDASDTATTVSKTARIISTGGS